MLTTKEAVSSYAAGAAYGIAAGLFVFPQLDALLATVPMRPGEISWQYGALVKFSRAQLPALLGGLLALTYALYLEQHRVVRGLAMAGGAWAIVLMGTALLFLGVAADVRAASLARDKTLFDTTTTIAVVKYVAAVLVSIGLAAPAWLAARRIRHEAHLATPDTVAPPQVVVRPHQRVRITV